MSIPPPSSTVPTVPLAVQTCPRWKRGPGACRGSTATGSWAAACPASRPLTAATSSGGWPSARLCPRSWAAASTSSGTASGSARTNSCSPRAWTTGALRSGTSTLVSHVPLRRRASADRRGLGPKASPTPVRGRSCTPWVVCSTNYNEEWIPPVNWPRMCLGSLQKRGNGRFCKLKTPSGRSLGWDSFSTSPSWPVSCPAPGCSTPCPSTPLVTIQRVDRRRPQALPMAIPRCSSEPETHVPPTLSCLVPFCTPSG